MLGSGTQRRVLPRNQSEENGNIKFQVGIESTTCCFYSHTLYPCAITDLKLKRPQRNILFALDVSHLYKDRKREPSVLTLHSTCNIQHFRDIT